MKSIEVCLTHQQLKNYNFKGKIVIIIDVLRATSTINTILYNGAQLVKPVETLEECKKYRDESYIIMAERMGKKVRGFDYGNSPTKIDKNEFEGRKVSIATSNGTKAIIKSKVSILGSFLNMSSLIDFINKNPEDALIVCSGWQGSSNIEDTLCAGGIICGSKTHSIISDNAIMAKELFESSKNKILETMMGSSHAKRLSSNDNIKDIEFCSKVDIQPVIPILKDDYLVLM